METILDHNPTTKEIGVVFNFEPDDFDTQAEYDEWFAFIKRFVATCKPDSRNRMLAVLYAFRRDWQKASYFCNQIVEEDYKADTVRDINYFSMSFHF